MKNALAILVILVSTNTSFAKIGGIGDGGGQGVVCRNDDGSIASAELLDLFEAKHYFLLNIPEQNEHRDYLDIALSLAKVLDDSIPTTNPMSTTKISDGIQSQTTLEVGPDLFLNHSSKLLQIEIDRLSKNKKLIPGEVMIPPVGDSNPRILPFKKGCQIEQIAIYKDGINAVYFVENIWNKLDNLSKSALLIHEALYRQLRLMGDTNSDRTRKFVSYLYGQYNFNWVFDGVPEQFLTCWTQDANHSFAFVVYPSSSNYATAQFLVWNGETVMSKLTTQMDLAPFAQQFGMQNIIQNNSTTTFQTINDPLLDVDTYAFSYSKNHQTNKFELGLQASAGVFDSSKEIPVQCKSTLTSVKYISGEVNIIPGQP